LLTQTVREKAIDVATLCEPYKPKQDGSWLQNHSAGAAIWSCADPPFQLREQSTSRGFVRAKCNGICIYSCYIAPSIPIAEYAEILDEIVVDARSRSPVIIAGDFNAWATEWGSIRTNARGRLLIDAFAILNVSLLNSGNAHTYTKAGRGSVIDLTFASACLA